MNRRIDDNIMLIPYDGIRDEALVWYTDPDIQWLVNKTRDPYSKEQLQNMYQWQKENGELYYIEYQEKEKMATIGDVWLSADNFAIVLAQGYQNKGIGTRIIKYFLSELKKSGRKELLVDEVYDWNEGSNKLFQKLGFKKIQKDEHSSYVYKF
ncbi:GNAT family N-acetyltransferase [Amphibacillus sp. Q70]|uniref:GNAT family N-acetyltransferase n=1 Tax=Amphibacillus sp. Q70 TaxID=3453416 RepID=UPI003F8603D2